jgi:uncharacterized protein YjbI with pentapeptide repeats
VAVGALMSCGSAIATTTPRALTPRYLFSIPTASGSLTGRRDQHLTLRLTDTRDYLTRFTDRPLRQANVVANVDFARRFASYFAGSAPNAVLTYTPRGARIPVSIVLTITAPHWNPKRSTWTFRATRIRKKSDALPGSTGHIKPPPIPNPRSFRNGTLLIDDTVGGCELEPSAVCEADDLAGANLQGLDLHEITFTGANLTGANLAGANLTGAFLSGTNFTGANLTGVILTGALLEATNFTNATIENTDLDGLELYSDNFIGANLRGDNLTNADLDYAFLNRANLSRANLTHASFLGTTLGGTDFSGANLTEVSLAEVGTGGSVNTSGATFCDTTWFDGSVLGGFTCPPS